MSAQLPNRAAVNEIAALLIPVNGKLLVLPNVTVAEIIHFKEPEPEDDVPTWYLGKLAWRTLEIPVVSFEAINDEPFASRSTQRRIVILNNITGDPQLPFCGIVTEAAPRLMRVMADEVATDDENPPGPAEVARVMVSGERAAIPDVAFIEREVLKLI